MKIVDPEVGGVDYVDFEVALDTLELSFAYAYAMIDEQYGYAWIVAVAPEGIDGGHLLQIGVDLDAYQVGGLDLQQMNSSITITHYVSWESEHPTGLAISSWDGSDVLELSCADQEVGGHVSGTLDVPMMEYRYDL